jgi:hypothetical protein
MTFLRRPSPLGRNGIFCAPSQFDDVIQGENLGLPPTPTPDCSGDVTAVEHWGQSWLIGSTTIGSGAQVQADTLHKDVGKAVVSIP